jgi:arylsulfatase A-like enzyme
MKKIPLLLSLILIAQYSFSQTSNKPNIILIMADDLGYGDVGFTENNIPAGDYFWDGNFDGQSDGAWDTPIQTPELDALAGEGLELSNFYSIGPVCSPTRGAFLTGRHYGRFGVFSANTGALPEHEITLATMCKTQGYKTGHFGKWHIGTLDENRSPKTARRGRPEFVAKPWERGYDYFFGTESSISTLNPQVNAFDPNAAGAETKNPYVEYNAEDTNPAPSYPGGLIGDDSQIMVDRVKTFITNAENEDKPFLATVWIHAPHEPFVASASDKAIYSSYTDQEQDYFGCITAMSRAIGNLNDFLKANNLDENTIVLFTSDNGPEGKFKNGGYQKPGRAGNLRGRKRSTYNGGVLVPSFIKWPGKTDVTGFPKESTYQTSVLDIFPTIMEVTGYTMPDTRPIDGKSIIPYLNDPTSNGTRQNAIPFLDNKKMAWIEGDVKFIINKNGEPTEAYNMISDRPENTNVIANYNATEIQKIWDDCIAWNSSVNKSYWGLDYVPEPFTPSEYLALQNNQTDGDSSTTLSEAEYQAALIGTWQGLDNVDVSETSEGGIKQEPVIPASPLSAIEYNLDGDYKFNVFPNPTANSFAIKGKLDGYKIKVFDIKGSVIKSIDGLNNEQKVNISQEPKGLYLVLLQNKTTGTIEFQKVLIKK